MNPENTKVIKPHGEEPSELELSISQVLLDLETNTELRAPLQTLHITGVKEMNVKGQKALVIRIPVPQLNDYHKIQTRLVQELEKKFAGQHIVFIAQRTILPKPTRKNGSNSKQKRPRSRTLTAVHDKILEDICFPSEIMGKRTCYKRDGSRQIKVHLDKRQETAVGYKVETMSIVYKQLTGKSVTFDFSDWILH